MTDWSIRQLDNGDKHLVGDVGRSFSFGRTTSKLVEIHDDHVVTESGRKYLLVGPAKITESTETAWKLWCVGYGIDPTTTLVYRPANAYPSHEKQG